MASAATASIKLHIFDLDPTVNQADLNSVFKNFVSSIKSIKIRHNGSLSSANIEFSDSLAAESARRELNGELVKNHHITITYFNPSYKKKPATTIYVKNFPESVINRDLEREFSSFGEVVSTKVVYDQTGHSLRYGYIQFDSVESSAQAIIARNGQEWMGCRLKVEHFIPCVERDNEVSKSNLHVCGFSDVTTKEEFDALFSAFGSIKSSVIKPKQIKGNTQYFGFVDFIEASRASAAATALNGCEALGGILSVQPFMRRQVREQLLKSQFKEKQDEWKRTNLVFAQLPYTMTEDILREICQEYGTITSIQLLLRPNFHLKDGSLVKEMISGGTGFVNFETA
jgi:polyadenylate-binding protein